MMNLVQFLLIFLQILHRITARIIQVREPTPSPKFSSSIPSNSLSNEIDSALNSILNNSMKELRLRLRETFYAHALNKHSNKPFEALSALDYENWLIEQYFSKSLKRDSVPSSSIPDTAKTGGTVPSHKMTIALETYTIGPDTIEKAVSQISKSGLLELDDATLDPPKVDPLQRISTQISKLPLWSVLLLSVSLLFILTLSLLAILLAARNNRKSTKFDSFKRPMMPNPLTISGYSAHLPSTRPPLSQFQVGRGPCYQINQVRRLSPNDDEPREIWTTTNRAMSIESLTRA